MARISRQEAFSQFQKTGKNSSHFVWFQTELEFFRASNGWIFAFKKVRRVTLLALEPLLPEVDSPLGVAAFSLAWEEFCAEIKPEISAFISIYKNFAELLAQKKWQTIQVGSEPWTELKDCIPTGKSGKGVRAGRNQALRAGYRVVEWKPAEIQADPQKIGALQHLLQEWKAVRPIDMSGFLAVVNPFVEMEFRRYFVVLSPNEKVEAFLVASPVPGIKSYFLEDMILGEHPPRGIGELLMLETLVALDDAGGLHASLGVVSMTEIGAEQAVGVPKFTKSLLVNVPRILNKIFNVHGLHTFRKRFKPKHWDKIHLAVLNRSECSDNKAWWLVLTAMLTAWEPKLQVNFAMVWSMLTRPLKKYSLTAFYTALTFGVYYTVNGTRGILPDWALQKFGFYGSAPLSEWATRSLVSDILYFDREHFWIVNTMLLALLFISERRYKKSFLLPLVFLESLLDDPLHFLVVIKPFEYFHPALFERLVDYKDVGSSLLVAFLIGMNLVFFRRIGPVIFALLAIGGILEIVLTNVRHYLVVLNINHFFFFCVGFIVGKLKLEYDLYREREVSRKVARQKPPEAKSVRKV